MSTQWVVVANRSFAKIYEVKGLGREIKEIHYLENPDGRKKGSEIVSDRPGRAFDRMGGGRHALQTKVDIHEHEQQVFAHKIGAVLKAGLDKQEFDKLSIIAPSHFLGDVKQVLPNPVLKTIFKEVSKDLPEELNEQDRISLISKYLDLWNQAK